ncbi:hypothetical protein BG011_007829 [Mortierella polycephala]|uniref:Starch synthase catalytic domain-containing protein n=1 Tax=Mortierella polycephala TaxID=41804 RepID=A0A9P6PSC0_9FUNG|nr:hypothetical protein BG011_007829 [Mortierella polycephala]
MTQQHHQHTVSGMSAHVSNGNSSSHLGSGNHDHSSGAGPGASIGSGGIMSSSLSTSSKNDSFFPPLTSSSQMDHSLSVGNSGYSKRSRFGVGNALSSAKRSRWWNYTAAMLLVFALIEAMILLIGSSALYSMPDQIQIDSRDFRKVEYQGLELDPDATYKKSIQVYHVAKEFGAASMGGLGMVVTALASAQQKARTQKVNVVLPYYSMLDKVPGIVIKHHISLSFDVQDNHKRTQSIIFNIYKYKHEVPFKASDYESDRRAINPVAVWLISPGDVYPFDRAFQSKDSQDIYSSPKGLPNEWKDLYFAKAVATFIQHQNRNSDISLFATAATRYIDVVHVHGATNALVLHYLQQSIERGAMGEEPPALIYTLHDYLDELQYSNEIVNIQKFMDKRVHSDDDDEDMFLQMDGISPYCHGHRMFTSAMGIDLADAVTFVSKTLAKDIVEGRLDFYLKELVLGSVLNQAEKNLFIGITNGIDFGKLNPWTMPELRKHDLTFPPKDLVDQEEEAGSPQGIDGVDDVAKIPTGMGSPNPTIRAAKEAAKHYLHTKGLLTEQDLSRPLVLFIGRFQYNKGVGFFSTACKEIKERGGKLIIMGQPNSFPLKSVLNLERLFKGTVKVVSDPKTQDDWGVYWRAAADFLLVPSMTESFGLVAAEGLLFGSTVISSGVGGLSEFLVDRPNPNDKRQQLSQEADRDRQFASIERHLTAAEREEQFNSYLFDAFATNAHSQLAAAIADALSKWKQLQRDADEHEEFLTRLVTSALSMGWDRAGGPVDQYRALYEIALNTIDFGQFS